MDMDDNVEIEFPKASLEIVEDWLTSDDGSVGACLLCGVQYRNQAEYDGHRCQRPKANE
jgi:hypothetical protein